MNFFSRFRRDQSGVAAVELALVMPVIAGMVVATYSVWDAGSRRQDIRAALNTGSEYYFAGGLDDVAAKAVVEGAWQRRPTDSSVGISRACACAATPLACSATCADGTPPAVYVTLAITSNDPTATVDPQLQESRVVRVR